MAVINGSIVFLTSGSHFSPSYHSYCAAALFYTINGIHIHKITLFYLISLSTGCVCSKLWSTR